MTAARVRRTPPATLVPAALLPVARVAVDIPLAHLDRPFDYLVPQALDEAAGPGVRVRIRFAGRLVDGYLLERVAESGHSGRLGFLDRVVSAEPVLSPEIAVLTRAVADRYAGSMADVLRLAVPPRHARTEAAPPAAAAAGMASPAPADPSSVPAGWRRYPAGPAFLAGLRDSRPLRAVWQALPGEDWASRLAEAAKVALDAGRGSVLLVPDAGDLGLIEDALDQLLPPSSWLTLSADLGPAERYRRFLAIRRGEVRVVAGTRAAAYAPVGDLGLIAIFDDGDDSYAEPRAPYPHAREVLVLRAAGADCALLIGGFSRTVEAELLLRRGWAKEVIASRAEVRRSSPRVEAGGDEHAVGADSAAAGARLSPAAFAVTRAALQLGRPVLVQVPRTGYTPALACVQCRRPARCRHCHGPLALTAKRRDPECRWCGIIEARFRCGACGGAAVRSTAAGAGRTVEELGRAFPGIVLINSSAAAVKTSVAAEAALVVATPGAEPIADGGYGAALLLDGSAFLSRPDLNAAAEALRRWMAAATLVVPSALGGRVVVGADSALPTVQALIRWDPAGHARAELDARQELRFPPVVAMASLEGSEHALAVAAAELEKPASTELLGPVPLTDLPGSDRPVDETVCRLLIRVAPQDRKALALALRHLAAVRSARKDPLPVRVRVDPTELF